MHKIKELTLQNFKFFYGNVPVKFDRKHVLIYGENGSGKSSIHWALYTFLQSVFKKDVQEVQKYFQPITRHEESIKNRYASDTEDAFIEITFEDADKDIRKKKISNTTVNTRPQTDRFVEQITLSSDLIDYKSIFNIYNYTNKDRVKLFGYFEKNLMPFINLQNPLAETNSKNLEVCWNYIKKGMNPHPSRITGNPEYDSFQAAITQLNRDFKYYLEAIAVKANEYLRDKFKETFEISFEYQDCSYNAFRTDVGERKVRNRRTIAPEIYLTAKLSDPNLTDDTNKIDRVHTFLNEARLSSIALAIRMAILKDKYVKESPKILVLDDLMLSLDMGNREAVLNIVLDEYCEAYQLVILTHDRSFFQTVLSYIKADNTKKLKDTGETNSDKLTNAYKEFWKVLEMYESSLPDGKNIPAIVEHQSHIQKALHYFTDKDCIDYNACGNNLRAALEEFFREFIPKEFLRDKEGNLIDKNSLTLNPLTEKCTEYFNHVGFNTENLDKINRYRERALNQTSHYNPHSNYFKKELQETFEILNELKKYRTDSVAYKDEVLQFAIKSQSGKEFSYKFKPLDDIRLYIEPKSETNSFYSDKDKRLYGLTEFTSEGTTRSISNVTSSLTLKEFYDETIEGLEKHIKEPCIKEADIYDVFKNEEGKSLNELKTY